MIFRLLIICTKIFVVNALARPHPDFEGYQTIHEYRIRNNITFNYQPKHLTTEHCRFVTEEVCRRDDEARGLAKQNRALNPSRGKFKVLVILVRFTDHRNMVLPPRSHFEKLFNGRGKSTINPIGSVREYVRYNSMGAYDVEFDVRDWRDTNNTEKFFAAGRSGRVGVEEIQKMYAPVLDQLDREGIQWWDYDVAGESDLTTGDGDLDHLVVIHSGKGAEHGDVDCLGPRGSYLDRIWSQGAGGSSSAGWESKKGFRIAGASIASAWRTPLCEPNYADMGVITHEFLHGFRLLDMYDDDKDADFIKIGGLGSFDIMSNAFGWRRSWHTPGHLSAYSKIECNWLTPIEITQDGYYSVQPAEISSQIYKIKSPYPEGEYLLIENRQKLKFDSDWLGSGIVIYHVDTNVEDQSRRGYPGSPGWPQDHYRVAVVQADGKFEIEKGTNGGDEGDFWAVRGMVLGPGGSQPNTDSYSTGRLRQTGLKITILSDSGYVMLFRVEGLGGSRARAIALSSDLDLDNEEGTAWSIKWVIASLSGTALVVGLAAMML